MSSTLADFRTRFPGLNTSSDAVVKLFLDDAALILNETVWGVKYDLGIMYYAAHLTALAKKAESGNSGSVGGVSSKAVDGVSVSMNTPTAENGSDAWLSSTTYGQYYIFLRDSLGIAACVI